jgi:hypothetical protein
MLSEVRITRPLATAMPTALPIESTAQTTACVPKNVTSATRRTTADGANCPLTVDKTTFAGKSAQELDDQDYIIQSR